MKYGIITLTYDDPLYNHFDNIKRVYYGGKHVPYTFVYNSPTHKSYDDEHSINYVSPLVGSVGIFTMLDKFIHTLNTQPEWKTYDYVIRANSSTFINLKQMEEVISTLPTTKCYAGYHTFPGKPSDFVSGTCMVFSKDVINMISSLPTTHENNHREDDLLLFDYMNQFNIPKTYIPMHWYDENKIPSIDELYTTIVNTPLTRIRNNQDRHTIDTTIWSMINYILNSNADCNNIF